MLTKEQLGQRLRIARFRRNMTLKEVAAGAGMSATHISEVERGKTSPTIGALQRIASALGERPSFFVEERDLPQVAVTRSGECRKHYAADEHGHPAAVDVVGQGIPGGVMMLFERTSQAGEVYGVPPSLGEVVLLCLSGMVRYKIGEESYVLREGDTLQLSLADGLVAETIGDEEHKGLAVFATPISMIS